MFLVLSKTARIEHQQDTIQSQSIPNPKLVHIDPMKVYRNYRVCHQHFTIENKSSNMYIKHTSIRP